MSLTHYELKSKLNDVKDRARAVSDELSALEAKDQLTEKEDRRLNDLTRAAANLADDEITIRKEWSDAMRAAAARGEFEYENGDGPREGAPRFNQTDTTRARFAGDFDGGALRSQALRTLQSQPGSMPDVAAERLTNVIEQSEQDWLPIARYVVTAGSPHYRNAFFKLLRDPVAGGHTFTPEERQAFARVQTEARALSLTDATGGYLVPTHLDPAIHLSSAGSINAIGELARKAVIATDQWNGVTSAGVTAEWVAEAATVADATPTLGAAPIPVHKWDAFLPGSVEIFDDAGVDGQNELLKLMIDARDNLLATAFTTGSGNGQPTGAITALAGTGQEINVSSSEAFTPSVDVMALLETVKARYRAGATWHANLAVMHDIAVAETTNGSRLFPGMEMSPQTILGRRIYENSAMDGTWDTGATANNYILACVNLSEFVWVSRIGTTVELIPHLFDVTNNRPTLQRGLIMWGRDGGDLVTNEAGALLDLPTTA